MSDYSINATIGADDSDFTKVVENVITGLGDISKSFESMSDDTKSSFVDIANQFQAIDGKAKVWGDSTDTISEKQKTLKDAINKLIESGIKPESEQIQDLKRSYDKLGESQDDTGKKSESLKDKFADLRDIMQGPIAAAKLIVDGFKEVIKNIGELSEEFAEDETAQLKFNAAIEASSVMTKGAAERLNTLAEALASSTGESNSAAQSQIAMLAATGRTEPEINKMITAAKGLAVATGVDLDTALNQINQTFSGTTGRLAKTTPALSDLSKAELENGGAVDILIEKYGDMGDALDNSSEVSIKNNTNAWGEVKSAIGKLVEESMKPLRDNMTEIYNGFAKWATTGNNLKETLSNIALVVGTIAAAVGAYVIVTNAATIASVGYTAATKLAAIAHGVLNAVLDANPIGLVAAAFAVAAVLIIKNWDLVSDTFKTVFAYIQYGVDTVVNAFKTIFAPQIENVKKGINTLSDTFKTVFAWISTNAEIIGNSIKSFFGGAFSFVKTVVADFVKMIADNLLVAIETLFTVASKIPGIGDSFKKTATEVGKLKNGLDKVVDTIKEDAKETVKTLETANTSAKDRLDKALKAIADEKAKRKDANDADIKGQDDSADNKGITEDKKKTKTTETVKYETEQNAKALDSYVKALEQEESAAIATAEKKKLSLADVLAIADEYNAKELVSYTAMVESQRKIALAEAADKKADAEGIANVNAQYDAQITAYKQTQVDERKKTEEDYTKNIEKLAKDKADFELKWAKQSTTDKQTEIGLERSASLKEAADKGADAKTIYNINKYYDDLSTKEQIANMDKIAGYSKAIVSAIGGDGADTFNSVVTTVTDIATAAASGFTDIGADIEAVASIIALSGKANEEQYADIQEQVTKLAEELLDGLSPVLSIILDVIQMLLPIIEIGVELIGDVVTLLSPLIKLIEYVINLITGGLKSAFSYVTSSLVSILKVVRDVFDFFGLSTGAIDNTIESLRNYGDTTKKVDSETQKSLASLMDTYEDATKTKLQLIEDERDAELKKAKDLGANEKQLALIRTYYNNKYKDEMASETKATQDAADAIIKAQDEKKKNLSSEMKTYEDATKTKLKLIDEELIAEIQKAKDLGASESQLDLIRTYYNNKYKDEMASETKASQDAADAIIAANKAKQDNLASEMKTYEDANKTKLQLINEELSAEITKATALGASYSQLNEIYKYYDIKFREEGAAENKAITDAANAEVKAAQDAAAAKVKAIADNASALSAYMKTYEDATKTKLQLIKEERNAEIQKAKDLGASTEQLAKITASYATKYQDELDAETKAAKDAADAQTTTLDKIKEAYKTSSYTIGIQLESINAKQLSFANSFSSIGTDIASSLVSNLEGGLGESKFMDTMKEYITNMVVQAAVYTDALKDKMASIGTAIANGISSGFSQASLQGIKDELSSLYTDAAKASKVATDIVGSIFPTATTTDKTTGYALGTENATAGYHIVGEQGPELKYFKGGETVIPAGKTASMLSGGSKTNSFNYTINSPTALNTQEIIAELKQYDRELAFSGVSG